MVPLMGRLPSTTVMSRVKVLAVALLLGALIASGCAGSTQPAIEVNGSEIDRADVNEAMRMLTPPVDAQGKASRVVGSAYPPLDSAVLPADARQAALVVLVESEVIRQQLEAAGEVITDADRAEGATQTETLLASNSLSFREEARSFLEDAVVLRAAFGRVFGGNAAAQLDAALGEAEIVLDPRFGRWESGVGPLAPGA